jgi:dTDP-4-amino-4,6-dideoxygalactose transaminase
MNQRARIDERPIAFIDLVAQRRRLGAAIDQAVVRVLAHCQFIQGPEVHVLEAELAAFCGVRHAITCASGTDALLLVLMAWQIGRGDAVICPSFTYHATAEMVVLLGATPIIADVLPDSFNIDPASCERAIAAAKRAGLNPRAIIPVDLFGLPADHDALTAIAAKHRLLVLDDAAQAFGARYRGKPIGALATATATSFFPAKPLGCYGDGGAVFTDDDALAALVKSLRLHGQGFDRSEAARIGITGRLDTIQAAVLIEKLKVFPEEIEARNLIAQRYSAGLADVATVPRAGNESTSVWAQYTIRVKPGQREPLVADLKARGIPTAIYYTRPLHRQPAYRHFPLADGGVPVSDRLAEEVLSLPMHAYLDEPVQDRIIESVRGALAN